MSCDAAENNWLSDCSTGCASEESDITPTSSWDVSSWNNDFLSPDVPRLEVMRLPQKPRKANLWARRRGGSAQAAPLACRQPVSTKMNLEHEPEISERYDVKNVLGSGHFSTVYRASMRETSKQTVALKVFNGNDDLSAVHSARQEFKILQRLPPHPHIVRVLDFHELCTHGPVLVLEFFDGPTLQELVTMAEERKLPEASVSTLGLALFRAVAHLHAHQVLHRDIKPQNIFTSRCLLDIRLGDFNVAKHFEDGESFTPVGDFLYRAPEVVSGESPSERSDVWSAGLSVLFALNCDSSQYRKLIRHKSGGESLDLQGSSPGVGSSALKSSLSGSLHGQPSSRPTAAQLAAEHSWFDM